MKSGLKQRIVGVLVLVALVVVFLPMLLDLQPGRDVDTSSRIPPAPDIEGTEIAEHPIPEGMEEPPHEGEAFVPSEDTALSVAEAEPATGDAEAAPAPDAPTLTAEGLPEAWVLQVGSFRDRAGADALEQRLLDAGHDAYVRTARSGGDNVHRVFVGPRVERNKLLEEKRTIDPEFGVDSLVLRFEP